MHDFLRVSGQIQVSVNKIHRNIASVQKRSLINTIIRVMISILLAANIGVYPQPGSAEGFTGHEFLRWERKAQDSLIQNSVLMIGIVAAQTELGIAPCIDKWYAPDDTVKRKRHDFILETIRKHPSYHPQGVVLAVVQKQCGSFNALN